MADRFYHPELATGEITLAGPEAHHLATVRRFTIGDKLTLFDGHGHEAAGTILAIGKKSVAVQVSLVVPLSRERSEMVVIAAAMPKGDRGDFLIEKLVELGVAAFVPLITARTIVQMKETRLENLERAVIEASKQCGRNHLMTIHPPMKWAAFVGNDAPWPGAWQVLHTATTITAVPLGLATRTVAIGPEGGFTPEEIALAIESGWQIASLGPRVLRTETAALAAAAR
ncbi:MAG: RsmE family RNA methyltransferase [Gemmataceae bacterium]